MQEVTNGIDVDAIGPGLIGFVVVFVLAVGAWMLFRSMNKKVRQANKAAKQPKDPGEQ